MTINMMVLLQKCSFVKLCTIIHNSLKHALKDVVVIFFRMTVMCGKTYTRRRRARDVRRATERAAQARQEIDEPVKIDTSG